MRETPNHSSQNNEFVEPLQVSTEIGSEHLAVAYVNDWPETELLSKQIDQATYLPSAIREIIQDIIQDYLRLPEVNDSFDVRSVDSVEAHRSRRAWEQSIDADEKRRVDKNALGGGNLGGVLPAFDALYATSFAPEREKLYANKDGFIPRELFQKLGEKAGVFQQRYLTEYATLSLDQKAAFMSEARAFMRGALKEIVDAYKPYTPAD